MIGNALVACSQKLPSNFQPDLLGLVLHEDIGEVKFALRVQCRRCLKVKLNPQQVNSQQDNDTLLCKICFDAPLQARLKSCGHLSMCTVCAVRITSCPICRITYDPDTLRYLKKLKSVAINLK